VGVLSKATPGKANPHEGPGFSSPVKFSETSRTFETAMQIELSSSGSGGEIRYTLDGTVPTQKSPRYDKPLVFTNSTELRARNFQPGLFPGPTTTHSYVQLHPNVLSFRSTLPVMVLETHGRNSPIGQRSSSVFVHLFDPGHGKTALTNKPTLTTRASFRVRGSSSSGFPKSGYALNTLDEFDRDRDLEILGLPADSDWVLYAPSALEPVLIHNPFVHQLSREMGHYSPRTRFLEVFVLRGSGRLRESYYQGIYVLQEKIKLGKNRVAVPKLGPDDLQEPNITGSYLLKFDRLGPDESGVFGDGNPGMVFVDPKEELIRLPQRRLQRRYIMSYIEEFENVLNGTNWLDPQKGYRAYFDVEAGIDFHLLEVLSGNVDAMVLSTHFYKPRNGRITFGPHWDFDRALGSTDGRDADPAHWNTGRFFEGRWWPRLFRDPDFWQRWVDRWQERRKNHFSNTNFHRLAWELTTQIQEAVPREYARWNTNPRGGSHKAEVNLMLEWLSNRVAFIDRQLTAPPTAELERAPAGGMQLVLTSATNSLIYYTLDGSDPRAAQGGVAPTALRYSNSIALPSSAKVVARSHDAAKRQRGGPPVSTPWSGPITISQDAGK
jgi:hypothetical protein